MDRLKVPAPQFRVSSFQFRAAGRLAACGLAFTVLLVFLTSCGARRETRLSGRTMGTTWHVTVAHGVFDRPRGLAVRIERRLDDLNRTFSTYRPDSEINRFNRWPAGEKPFEASGDFAAVLRAAARIHALSGGAWDGTVGPLVDLWGFGSATTGRRVPADEEIRAARERVGFDAIRPGSRRTFFKEREGLALDLASIAKGFAVDALAELIRGAGYTDFLAEIGGEVVAGGRRSDGLPWRVGINTPRPGAAADAVHRVVGLSERAMATSGDYRNFFELEGRRYSHLIDPRSGRPVSNGVVSTTVLAADCTQADGLATAVTVMGVEAGLALVEGLPGVEALLVTVEDRGALHDHISNGFPH